MKHTKLLAVFAVLIMVIGSMACLVATSENNSGSDANATYSVTLDASKDFTANKSELNKLGITDQSAWKKDGTETTLVLDNVNFTTKNATGVVIKGNCSNFKIVLKGENTIACGTSKTALTDYVCGLWEYEGIAKTTITGDGQLTITCDGVADGWGGSGLYVVNDLIVSQCKLIVVGPSLKQTDAEVNGRYVSNGICVDEGKMTVTDGAKVIAYGGDVSAKGRCYYDEKFHSTRSTGITLNAKVTTPTLIVKDSTVIGLGGDVISETRGFETGVDLDTRSLGIYAKSDISLDNAILRGYGGTAIGKDPTAPTTNEARQKVLSAGLRFNGDIEAIDSEITMYGGKAVSNEMAVSAGIRHFMDLDDGEAAANITISLTNCDLWAFGGASASDTETKRGKAHGGSYGLYASEIGTKGDGFDITITLDYSIAYFGGNRNYDGACEGIRVYSYKTESGLVTTPKGTVIVKGSEFYANGYTKAIVAEKVVSKGYEYCYVGTEPYTQEYRAKPVNFTDDGVLYCVVGFQYNLFTLIGESIYSPVMTYAYDQAKVKLPNYEMGYIPDGQKFKCWSINGVEYKPGQVVDLSDGPLTAIAVFEKDTGSENTLMWIAIVFIIVIAIVLLALVIIYTRPKKVAAPEAKTSVKKATKPKSTAKKTTAKRTTAKKPASKTKTKRTSNK